jgi:hypothetical protein
MMESRKYRGFLFEQRVCICGSGLRSSNIAQHSCINAYTLFSTKLEIRAK